MATLGMHSSAGVDWSAGISPDDDKVVVDSEQTDRYVLGQQKLLMKIFYFRLGIKYIETEKKWVYQHEEGKLCDCLTSKEAVHSMLLFLEKQMEVGHLQGVLLVTVLDDFTLTHLLTLMKNNGLARRFGNVVRVFQTWSQFGN